MFGGWQEKGTASFGVYKMETERQRIVPGRSWGKAGAPQPAGPVLPLSLRGRAGVWWRGSA